MSTLRRHEGYFLRDDRLSGGGMQECATLTCSHCQTILIVNPLRTRERAYCSSCDHYLCDACGAARAAGGGGPCLTFKHRIEEEQERAVKQAQERGIILI